MGKQSKMQKRARPNSPIEEQHVGQEDVELL